VTDRPLSLAASAALVRLAECVGAGLADVGGGAAFPVGHPHDVTEGFVEAVRAADFVLFVDVRDPGLALGTVNLATREVEGLDEVPAAASIGLGPLMDRSWMVTTSAGPERAEIVADPELALDAVLAAVDGVERELDAAFASIAARPPRALPGSATGPRGLHRGHVARLLAEALAGTDWVLAHGQFGGWARRGLRFQRADQFLGRGGADGLGYGPGAAVGAALALRGSERLVVSLQGDGDLMYTPQALWTAAHHGIPLLVVVDANRTYGKDEQHQTDVARERGRPTANVGRGIGLDGPVIDHAAMARSLGVLGLGPVETIEQLEPALRRALEAVRAGEPALVEVRTALD
jgi:thiamine pyrophosphate-dependent acetolactate synthase large subunit-like protein